MSEGRELRVHNQRIQNQLSEGFADGSVLAADLGGCHHPRYRG